MTDGMSWPRRAPRSRAARTWAHRGAVMKHVLTVAAIGEVLTGVALLFAPSFVASLLLGGPLADVALPVARVAGLALIGLGIACWPGPSSVGMLVYSAAVARYLAWLGFTGAATGPFLWPAVIVHLILTGLLIGSVVRSARD